MDRKLYYPHTWRCFPPLLAGGVRLQGSIFITNRRHYFCISLACLRIAYSYEYTKNIHDTHNCILQPCELCRISTHEHKSSAQIFERAAHFNKIDRVSEESVSMHIEWPNATYSGTTQAFSCVRAFLSQHLVLLCVSSPLPHSIEDTNQYPSTHLWWRHLAALSILDPCHAESCRWSLCCIHERLSKIQRRLRGTCRDRIVGTDDAKTESSVM